jgi:hypothetical protein
MSEDTRRYLETCYGETEGWCCVAVGSGPHRDGNGKYRHLNWDEVAFEWPAAADRAVEYIARAALLGDVYCCPYLMKERRRVKGGAVQHVLVHADVDGDLDLAKVAALGGFVVGSGTAGHGHAYIRLSWAITDAQHQLLCRGLVELLGGDAAKCSDNDLLRPPGTLSYKSAVDGGEPSPVTALRGDDGRLDPGEAAALVGVDIANAERKTDAAAAGNRRSFAVAPFVLEDYPAVAEALAKHTGDRSADTMRVTTVCFDAGLSLPQARWAVRNRTDLAARLDEFADRRHPVDDVAACWSKIAPSLRVVTDKASTNGQAADPAHSGPLADALDVFGRWLHLGDTAPVLVTAATVVANLAEGDPVWLLVVGPPSGGKTEILASLTGLDYIVPAATVTEAALLSGTAVRDRTKGATGGLLRQAGEFGILLAKDFTSVLSQNSDTAGAAMAALREVYDGRWDRPVGTDGGKVLTWQGKCGFIGGVTPSYDRYASIVSALGARFLLLRLPRPNRTKQSAAALKAAQHEKKMRTELAEAMQSLIAGANLEAVGARLDAEEETRLSALAEFTSCARTAVERDRSGELLVLPEPEGPARIVKAMRQLYGALGALGANPETQWGVLTRVALDSMPAIRAPLAHALLRAPTWRRTADLAEDAQLSTKTAGRHLENLMLLGIAKRTKRKPTDMAPQKPGDELATRDNSPFYWLATGWLTEHWPEKVGPQPTGESADDAPGP